MYEKIIGIPHQSQSDEGIELFLSTKEDMINEICDLRKAINNIQTDLKKFKGMRAYSGEVPLCRFETKYIEDALGICDIQLDVKYVHRPS